MKIIFIFPGYGSQFVGMCKEIYDTSRLVQECFEEASNCLDINFVKLCFASAEAELAGMGYAYPALFLVCASLCSLLKNSGINPDAVAGYGIGEYSALYAANSINIPDALYLLSKLSTLYTPYLCDDLFRIIRVQGLSSIELNKIIRNKEVDVVISAHTLESEHLVVGSVEAIVSISQAIKSAKGKIKRMPLAYGLHSQFVQDVYQKFKPYMVKVDIHDLSAPLISCIDGRPISRSSAVRERIAQAIISPVKWTLIVKMLRSYDVIVEIGPPSPYIDQLRSQFTRCTVLSVSKPADIELAKEICLSSSK